MYLYLLFILLLNNIIAQNKQILYDFDQIPQTLLLNPGAEVDYDTHVGVPLLSNFYLQVGATDINMTYNNILAGTDGANQLLTKIYKYKLDDSDYFSANQQMDIINAGFRLSDPDYYLSFGIYEEIDGFSNYPIETAILFFEGDDKNNDGVAERGVITNFNKLNLIADIIGVYHVGISKKIGDNLNIGARFKLISGSLNINSKNNEGNYFLSDDTSGFYHKFNDMQMNFNSSGLIHPDGSRIEFNPVDFLKGFLFLNENIGLGIDLGFTYHINDRIVITGSLLDLDYVSYSNKVVTYQIDGDFILEDDQFFNPPKGGEIDYWINVFDDGDYGDIDMIPIDTLQTAYNTYRTPKVNTSAKYQFLRKKKGYSGKSVFRNVACDVNTRNNELISEVGIHTYTAFRPDKIVWAVTAYYSYQFNNYFSSKITYTYDKFSYKNIGLGISTHFRSFNFYATADNLLALYKIKDSNYQSFQFGMNFIFE